MPVRVRLWARLWAALRAILWVVLGLAAGWIMLLLGVDSLLRTEVGQRRIRKAVVELLTLALETDVELRHIQLSGFRSLTLEGFTLYDKNCEPFVRVAAIEVSWTPFSFWRGFWRGRLHIPLSALKLYKPQVFLYAERASGLTNVDRLFPSDTTEGSPSAWRISLPELRLEEGTFWWRDSTHTDSALQPTPGYLNYANLWIDSLFLSASVEILPRGRLFAQIRHLQLLERNAGTSLPHLALTVAAYPDSTVIPTLEIRLLRSELRGNGRFFQEGLDKLFANTDTKRFSAQLAGKLAWKELYAFIGDSIPLRGEWEVDLSLTGDLLTLQANSLSVSFAPGRHIRGMGKVVHYARPKQIHWEATLSEVALSLADLRQVVDGLDFPEELSDSVVWQFSAEHRGRLGRYWVALQMPTLTAEGEITRVDTLWRYALKATLAQWRMQALLPTVPLNDLSGSFTIQGEGFTLPTLRLAVDLQGLYDTLGTFRVASTGAVQAGQFSGALSAQTPYGKLTYVGSLPLTEGVAYEGKGYIDKLTARLWGGTGTLSSPLRLRGKGFPWGKGQSQLDLDSLRWLQPDTTYDLGHITLQAQEGVAYSATGKGGYFILLAEGNWLKGLNSWTQSWAKGFTDDQWAASDSLEPWSCAVRAELKSPFWLALAGLPVLAYQSVIVSWIHQESGQPLQASFRVSWDSLRWAGTPLRTDAGRLRLELTHDTLPHWQLNFSSDTGYLYLPYRGIRVQLAGSPKEGNIQTYAGVGNADTAALHLNWLWPTVQKPLALFLGERPSYLTLGGTPWRFSMESPLYAHLSGYWEVVGLRAATPNASAHLSRDSSRLQVEVTRLPIGDLLALLGYDLDFEGLLRLSWQATQGAPDKFSLGIDSLTYRGEPYPQIRAAGETRQDTLPFTLSLQEGKTEYLFVRGVYALSDTVAPLYAELRSVQIPARWLAPFLSEYIVNPKGRLRSQRIRLFGRLDNPKVEGELFCDRVSFYVPFVRVQYAVEGVIRLRGDSVYLPDLALYETHGKKSLLSGYIALRGWQSPFLSLQMRVIDKPFLLAAAPPSADAYLYGRAELDQGSLSLTGPWNKPEIRGEVRFAESTDLLLPLQTYERSSGTPHLRFKADSPAQTPRTLTAPGGVDARIALRSVPQARFQILFDERTGDRIVAQGTANLFLTLTTTGEVRLSGSYEIQGGEYRVNLQGAVAKKLLLQPGSTLTWDGDLYEGKMRIIATYHTFTSLRMIDSTFTYTVPVELRVFLEGPLLAPVLRFQIEVPSLSGGATPLVNLFLQRLASDEVERNRQVFALLVFGTFIPLEQGVGSQQVSSGVSSTLAEFLSAQLASWIGQTLGNQLGVSFALGQWNELSAQLRLSLGQRFTLERDGVVVGPGQSTPSLGNLSARYRLLPKRITQPTQWQLEMEGFSRQTFLMGVPGAATQGAGLRLRKSFYLPERRRKQPSDPPQKTVP